MNFRPNYFHNGNIRSAHIPIMKIILTKIHDIIPQKAKIEWSRLGIQSKVDGLDTKWMVISHEGVKVAEVKARGQSSRPY